MKLALLLGVVALAGMCGCGRSSCTTGPFEPKWKAKAGEVTKSGTCQFVNIGGSGEQVSPEVEDGGL